MLFDINAFDETLPGPWEWDVKRLAASLEILGRDRGFADGEGRRDIVVQCVARVPPKRVNQAAGLSTLDAWYDHRRGHRARWTSTGRRYAAAAWPSGEGRQAERMVADAFSPKDSVRVFSRRVTTSEGEARIVAEPPLIVPIEDLATPGSEWEDPAPADQAAAGLVPSGPSGATATRWRSSVMPAPPCKVVGVGSDRHPLHYILLLLGRDDNDPLFLQVERGQDRRYCKGYPATEHLPAPWRACGGGPAPDAGGHRHLPRLAAHPGSWTGSGGITTSAQFQDWKGWAGHRRPDPGGAPPCTAASAGPHGPCPLPMGRTGSPWPPTWVEATASSAPSAISPAATPTRNEQDFEEFQAAARSGRIEATPVA